MAQLVIVSNRVAVPDEGAARAGGLEVAVKAALKRMPGLWFGWSGRVTPRNKIETRGDHARQDHLHRHRPRQGRPPGILQRLRQPGALADPALSRRSRRISRVAICPAICGSTTTSPASCTRCCKPDDLVWVHDYHLMPLAKALRDLGHKNRIGFFLHIPCPPPEMLTALPQPRTAYSDPVRIRSGRLPDRRRRLQFHPLSHARMRPAQPRFQFPDRRPQHAGRCVPGRHRDVQPSHGWRSARSAPPFVSNVLDSLAGRAMIIGVDRLDYSKGIPQRLDAFERFLATQPDWRGKVTYLQITPKSRSDIREYAEMEQGVGATVGRINGAYGEADWTPIRYVNRTYSRVDAGRPLSRRARGPGHAAARRHEPRGQGIRRLAESGRSGRADPVAFCRRRARMRGGAAGQSLRSRQRRRRASGARCRCRSTNGASATRRCSRSCRATTSRTGPTASSQALERPAGAANRLADHRICDTRQGHFGSDVSACSSVRSRPAAPWLSRPALELAQDRDSALKPRAAARRRRWQACQSQHQVDLPERVVRDRSTHSPRSPQVRRGTPNAPRPCA